jgi:hypothetical protein
LITLLDPTRLNFAGEERAVAVMGEKHEDGDFEIDPEVDGKPVKL